MEEPLCRLGYIDENFGRYHGASSNPGGNTAASVATLQNVLPVDCF